MTIISEAATAYLIEVDGIRIHYHDVGTGAPLLMMQTWGPSPGTTAWSGYSRIIEALSERYRCLLLDLPNYGRSGPVTFHEPIHDLYARTAVRLLDELGIGCVSVVGNSQGATSAIDMAINYPDRVKNLVVGACHASTGGDPYLAVPFPSEVGRLYREAHQEPPDRDKLRRLYLAMFYDELLVTDELVEDAYQWRFRAPQHTAARVNSVSTPHSNLLLLGDIKVPTLIIHGRFDRMVPYEQALMLLNYIDSSHLVVLNKCGHWPQYEQPEEYTSHLLRFLARVDA